MSAEQLAMTLAPDPWAACQSRYVAYCRAHWAATPEAMLARDEAVWPGGCMTGYILWITRKWRKWTGPAWDHDGFDAWLAGGSAASPAPGGTTT